MTRHPATPDCGIRGCTRAAYRQDLCRTHYAMLPREAAYARAAQTMLRIHSEAKARRAETVAALQAQLDGVAP